MEDDNGQTSTALARRADHALQLTGVPSVPSQYVCHQGVVCAQQLRACDALQLDVDTRLIGLESFTLSIKSKGCKSLV